jgi:hypothetical protein
VALVLVIGAPAVAHAAPQPTFAANFRGTAVVYLATPACSYAQQTFRARFVDSLGGRGSFKIDGCWDDVNYFQGTFQIDDADGTHRGTVEGVLGGSSPRWCRHESAGTFDFVLTPPSGTPRHLEGDWCQAKEVFGVPWQIAGTLSA